MPERLKQPSKITRLRKFSKFCPLYRAPVPLHSQALTNLSQRWEINFAQPMQDRIHTFLANSLLVLNQIKSITYPFVKPTFHQDAAAQLSYVNSSTWESPFPAPLPLPSGVEPKLRNLLIIFCSGRLFVRGIRWRHEKPLRPLLGMLLLTVTSFS